MSADPSFRDQAAIRAVLFSLLTSACASPQGSRPKPAWAAAGSGLVVENGAQSYRVVARAPGTTARAARNAERETEDVIGVFADCHLEQIDADYRASTSAGDMSKDPQTIDVCGLPQEPQVVGPLHPEAGHGYLARRARATAGVPELWIDRDAGATVATLIITRKRLDGFILDDASLDARLREFIETDAPKAWDRERAFRDAAGKKL